MDYNYKILDYIFFPNKIRIIEYINTIISFSERVRKEGLFVIEEDIPFLIPDYFQKSLQLIMDGVHPDLIKVVLTEKQKSLLFEYREIIKIFFINLSGIENIELINKMYLKSVWISEDKRSMLSELPKLLETLQLSWKNNNEIILPPTLSEIFLLLNSKVIPEMQREILLNYRMNLENSMESILNIFREGSLAIQSGENPSVVRELLYSFIPDNLDKQ
jgi:hypothetical protein